MQLSRYVLEAMGFRPLRPTERVRGSFSRIDVLGIQGIALDCPCFPLIQDKIDGFKFKFAIGNSINEICRQLTADSFIEDEDAWLKEKNAAPPYAVIMFGPTDEYVGDGSHMKEDGDEIATYDSFGKAKEDLKSQSDAVVPKLMTALSIMFSAEDRLVRFIPKDMAVSGKAPDGRIIHDIRMTVSAEATISRNIDALEVKEKSSSSIQLAKSLNAQVANFYFLALNEKDLLKRFIYFFIFIERMVHLTFSDIDHQAAVGSLLDVHSHVKTYGQKMLADHRDSWKDLRNRFTWCVMHKWTHLNDSDIEKFEQLKLVRDSISHGKLSSPDAATVRSVEALAIRLQQAK
jgi:hypothetical protein